MNKNELNTHLVEILQLGREQSCSVLDIGCGYGFLLAEISKAVGSGSRLIGMDSAKESIEWANQQFPDIEFQQSKFVDTLDYPDSSFDVISSIDTLECIPDKQQFLREIARVLTPNGRVLIAHWDWDTQVYNSENKDIMRRVVASFADWQQGWMDACDGQMGRKLWGLVQQSRLFAGRMHSYTLLETEFAKGRYGFDRFNDVRELVNRGEFPQSDYDVALAALQALHENGEYFYSLTPYIYDGELI